jgi:hypothetical protein
MRAVAAMQRVIVRMLHDPCFADAVFASRGACLSDLDLPERWLTALLAHPRAAYGVDAERSLRLLGALAEEFRISTALFLLHVGQHRELQAFCHSAAFHAAVQERRYVALAFAEWLHERCAGEDALASASAILQVEWALARARRPDARPAAATSGEFRRVAGVEVAVVPRGTLSLLQATEKYLFRVHLVAHAALAQGLPTFADAPALDAAQEEGWLAEQQRGLSGIPLPHALALRALEQGDALELHRDSLGELCEHGLVQRV